jgi:hypothetical protein
MTPDEMLAQLHIRGCWAGADYDDRDDVDGWFGWGIHDGVLTVTHKPREDSGPSTTAASSWRLVPLDPTEETR